MYPAKHVVSFWALFLFFPFHFFFHFFFHGRLPETSCIRLAKQILVVSFASQARNCVSIRAFSEINNHQQKKAYEEQAAILLTSKQISLVITGESNSFLSVFSERSLLQPKCVENFHERTLLLVETSKKVVRV